MRLFGDPRDERADQEEERAGQREEEPERAMRIERLRVAVAEREVVQGGALLSQSSECLITFRPKMPSPAR